MTTVIPEAWDQLKGESDKAYRAFIDYAEMGPARSLRDLHRRYLQQRANAGLADTETKKIIEKPPTDKASTIFTWSTRYQWQERVKGYDTNEKRIRLIEHESAVKEMSRKHVQQAQVLAQGLMLPAMELLRRLRDNPGLVRDLDLDDLTTLMVKGARIMPHVQKAERLAMGQPTELLELWALSDDEVIAKYKNLLDEIRAGSGLEAADQGDELEELDEDSDD